MTHRTYLLIAAASLSLAGCNPSGEAPADRDNAAESTGASGTVESGGGPAANVSTAAAGGEGKSGIPCPFGGTKAWKAWVDAMPGPGKQRTLIVIGQVNVGNDGYAGELTPTFQEESNPPIQHFDLTLVEKAGAKAGWQEVREDHRPAGSYRAVVVDCHGGQVGKVQPVPIAS